MLHRPWKDHTLFVSEASNPQSLSAETRRTRAIYNDEEEDAEWPQGCYEISMGHLAWRRDAAILLLRLGCRSRARILPRRLLQQCVKRLSSGRNAPTLRDLAAAWHRESPGPGFGLPKAGNAFLLLASMESPEASKGSNYL